jgi:hypothetical protein
MHTLAFLTVGRQGESPSISSHERIAPMLCAYGLIAELVAAGAGYAICVYIWGNFYFGATDPGNETALRVGQQPEKIHATERDSGN